MEDDDYGRLTRRSNGGTGEEGAWSYDGQGNPLQHTRAGQPSERWTYSYTYGDQQHTIVERLEGSGYTRTAVFQEDLLKSEVLNSGTGSATRTYEYEGGRLKRKND